MKINILMVEDDEAFVKMLSVFLDKRTGWQTTVLTWAASIKEAEAQLRTDHTFDIILLDLSLRNGMGLKALLGFFRKIVPALPVYILTGDESPEVEEEVLANGARGHMRKTTLVDARQIEDLVREMHQVIKVFEAERKINEEWAKMSAHMQSMTTKAAELPK